MHTRTQIHAQRGYQISQYWQWMDASHCISMEKLCQCHGRRCRILIGPRVLANIYLKEQTEFIQNQIDKIRDSVEDRQSRIAWQTINKVSRRKSTSKAKLKATNQQERIKLWKQHFENLLGNPRKLLMNQSPELFVSN